MAYPTLALHVLISAPGDVPTGDMAVIRRTISQWNLNFGRVVGLTALPVSWTEHAVAEFGERPQAVLNSQIVEEADMAIALFYDRLGTPTGVAESGTLRRSAPCRSREARRCLGQLRTPSASERPPP